MRDTVDTSSSGSRTLGGVHDNKGNDAFDSGPARQGKRSNLPLFFSKMSCTFPQNQAPIKTIHFRPSVTN
jgi:hypothetical protein